MTKNRMVDDQNNEKLDLAYLLKLTIEPVR